MTPYSPEDATKTQGRTAATSTVPAQEHRDHTSRPHPETRAGYRSRGSCTTLDSPAASASRLDNARSSGPHTTEKTDPS
jgi:hypothetical protein